MINENISKLYLASKSPRRKELLAQIGIDFTILAIDIPEEVASGEDYLSYSQRICREKAIAAIEYINEENLPILPVLSADTEVVINNEVLGKAASYDEAFLMWKKLVGNKHIVVTTVTLKYADFEETVSSESLVYFDEVSDDEIHQYLATADYVGKSGSYGIQSFAGQFIKKIDGCFYSIMGLPLNTVRNLCKKLEQHLAAK